MSEDKRIKSLASYHLLGRSGLRVSPLCLGTMTFGHQEWGCDEKVSRQIWDRFLQSGCNFIDTADLYAGGESERIIGRMLKEDGNRDEIVLATKFNFNRRPADPNGGGNSRKHILEAVEASLERLQTDYIDLYWMHAWDTLTPVEEVVSTLNRLVDMGKVRYYGFSDTPAWYVGAAHAMATCRGWAPPIAMQLEYSLACRDIEYEFVPAAQNLGLGITPWSPLSGGLLTGKYKRGEKGDGRLETMKNAPNPVFNKLTEKNFKVVDVLLEVAKDVGRNPAQVALNWVTKRPGVSSTIIGASKVEQLESNLQALEFELNDEQLKKLDESSNLGPRAPYMFFEGHLFKASNGENPVRREPVWFR